MRGKVEGLRPTARGPFWVDAVAATDPVRCCVDVAAATTEATPGEDAVAAAAVTCRVVLDPSACWGKEAPENTCQGHAERQNLHFNWCWTHVQKIGAST